MQLLVYIYSKQGKYLLSNQMRVYSLRLFNTITKSHSFCTLSLTLYIQHYRRIDQCQCMFKENKQFIYNLQKRRGKSDKIHSPCLIRIKILNQKSTVLLNPNTELMVILLQQTSIFVKGSVTQQKPFSSTLIVNVFSTNLEYTPFVQQQ